MIQIDLQASFLVGSTMALVARKRLRSASDEWIANARNVVLAFGGMVFAPVWLYITLRWCDWETMYMWDLSTVPRLLLVLFLPCLALAGLAGFYLTKRLIRANKLPAALLINGVVIATCVAVALIGWDRFTFVGTVAEFEAGGRGNLLGSDLLRWLGLGALFVFAPAAVLIVHWLRTSEDD